MALFLSSNSIACSYVCKVTIVLPRTVTEVMSPEVKSSRMSETVSEERIVDVVTPLRSTLGKQSPIEWSSFVCKGDGKMLIAIFRGKNIDRRTECIANEWIAWWPRWKRGK